MATTQQEIDRLKGIASSVTSTVGAAIALISGFAQRFRDAADDPDEIRALADGFEADKVALAQAIAAGTPAAEEVPGVGADEATVDPEATEIVDAVEEAVAPADDTDTGTGDDG